MRKSFTVNGKRYEVYGKTQKEIDDKYFFKRLELERQNGSQSLRGLSERWLSIKKDKVTTKNYRMYERDVVYHLSPILDKPIESITFLDCQDIVNGFSGYSDYSIRKKTSMLKSIFGLAVKSGLIDSNPAEFVVKPKGDKHKRRSLTDAERQMVVSAIEKHEHGLYFKLMLYCGLRPHECAFIQGKDISDGLLHVRGVKTVNADRWVVLPDGLISGLSEDEYLFPNLTEKKRNRWWNSLKKNCDIPDDITPYCFRHTFCTDLERIGVPLNIARQMMGHSDIRITSEIYTHTSKNILKNYSDALKTLVSEDYSSTHQSHSK